MVYKILFSNLGYARGINGTIAQHARYFYRHFYTSRAVQNRVLAEMTGIIATHDPDLCCMVELDSGAWNNQHVNQMTCLAGSCYLFQHYADKYRENSVISLLPFHQGKSNGFMAKHELPFQKLYFKHGTKRLIYHLQLDCGVHVLFAHFSLNRIVRAHQFAEIRDIVHALPAPVIILGDFNIMRGFGELAPLLTDGKLCVLNDENAPTFTFGRRRMTLDLCVCSAELAGRIDLHVIAQPFSDHDALLVELRDT